MQVILDVLSNNIANFHHNDSVKKITTAYFSDCTHGCVNLKMVIAYFNDCTQGCVN